MLVAFLCACDHSRLEPFSGSHEVYTRRVPIPHLDLSRRSDPSLSLVHLSRSLGQSAIALHSALDLP